MDLNLPLSREVSWLLIVLPRGSGPAQRVDLDEVLPEGHIEDKDRTIYLENHIAAALRAARQGASLAGYFVWSFLDNFEWKYG